MRLDKLINCSLQHFNQQLGTLIFFAPEQVRQATVAAVDKEIAQQLRYGFIMDSKEDVRG